VCEGEKVSEGNASLFTRDQAGSKKLFTLQQQIPRLPNVGTISRRLARCSDDHSTEARLVEST